MFVNEWEWYSGIKDGPLPSPAVLSVASVRERKPWQQKKSLDIFIYVKKILKKLLEDLKFLQFNFIMIFIKFLCCLKSPEF